ATLPTSRVVAVAPSLANGGPPKPRPRRPAARPSCREALPRRRPGREPRRGRAAADGGSAAAPTVDSHATAGGRSRRDRPPARQGAAADKGCGLWPDKGCALCPPLPPKGYALYPRRAHQRWAADSAWTILS